MKERNMSFFMKGKAKQLPEEEVIVSKRYVNEKNEPIPFVIRAIEQPLIDRLQDECTEPIYRKGKKVDEKLNVSRFLARMGVESTVFPNFKDPELLASYKLVDPVDLAKEILKMGGEYAEWLAAVQRINGYDEDFEELVNDAKNSSGGATGTQTTPTSPSTDSE
jgi:hypothetical protein